MDEEMAKRADLIAARIRGEHTFDSAINVLALHMVALEDYKQLLSRLLSTTLQLGEHAKSSVSNNLDIADIALSSARIGERWANEAITRRNQSSTKARKAAAARHEKPGGSKEKQEAIRAIWASGKYKSRAICAEQECAGLNMSPDTARKALRNTPNPA